MTNLKTLRSHNLFLSYFMESQMISSHSHHCFLVIVKKHGNIFSIPAAQEEKRVSLCNVKASLMRNLNRSIV